MYIPLPFIKCMDGKCLHIMFYISTYIIHNYYILYVLCIKFTILSLYTLIYSCINDFIYYMKQYCAKQQQQSITSLKTKNVFIKIKFICLELIKKLKGIYIQIN